MTLSEAKSIYMTTGKHFFDKDTIRYWGSRIESSLYKNRCFVTSEKNFDGTKRFYTIRRFSEDYTKIETIGEFQGYVLKDNAREAAKNIK